MQLNTIGQLYWIGWVGALASVLVALPLWRGVCLRIRFLDAPGSRKLHHTPTPLAGGLAVLSGLLIAMTVLMAVSGTLRNLVEQRLGMWLAIAGGAVFMTLLGVLDDRHELKPGTKFGLQFVVALAVAAAGLRITLFIPHLVFQYAITVLWILAVINAFNFMDNMNGLCAGLGAIAAATFAAAASRHDQQAEACFALLVCGALLGFLPRAFLGDGGSHLVGFCMAVLAILPSFHTQQDRQPLAVLKPLLILAVPLLDMAWVVLLRWNARKPFYLGDTNHLSHRLVRRNLTPPVAVALIWLVAAICGGLSLL